ncbi:uncharacterized protein LOC120353597 isoform X2 [Nilaparvata lugens]|uniref:uncharacterized protein LOC120353597 isoform X2 n=1 Tax=Nilaparvata lugens TaxID=108931 RepID=UPI00193E6F01|nr:uncharacterized protein LOC120353597 isoform X2 [Nilaparvata lugens]
MDFVSLFPIEVTDIVLSHLSPNERNNCKNVSELWNRVIVDFIQREHLRLKTNFENRRYCVCPCDFSYAEFRHLKVSVLPSNVPHDYCIYWPVFMRTKNTSQLFHFQLFQITKSGLTLIVSIAFPRPEHLLKVCVMGNSVVLITRHHILFFDGHHLRTIMPIIFPDPPYELPYLTMDTHHIVFIEKNSNLLLVWCKQAIKVIFYRSAPDICLKCSLFDGCFIISSGENDPGKTSRIEVRNLRNAPDNMLQLYFLVDGKVDYLKSNERFLFLYIETYDNHCIQVRDKESYSITYRYKYSVACCVVQVSDDFVFVNDYNKPKQKFEWDILTLSTGECYTAPISSFSGEVHALFDRKYIIEWCGIENKVKVMDWRKNTIWYLQHEYPESKNFVIIGVTELMIVAIDRTTGMMINFIFE